MSDAVGQSLSFAVGVAVSPAPIMAMGDRSESILDRLKQRMARNNAAITAVVCLIFGAKLIGDAISGLG